jgi:hypothetical protein
MENAQLADLHPFPHEMDVKYNMLRSLLMYGVADM